MSSLLGAAATPGATTEGVGAGGAVTAARRTVSGGRRGGPASTRWRGGSSSADATSAKAGSTAHEASVAPISARIRIAAHLTSDSGAGEEQLRPVPRY